MHDGDVFQQKLLGKAYLIVKMTAPSTVWPAGSDKWKAPLAKGDSTELRPVAYSPTRSSGHAFKLPVIKYDFYEFSKST